MTETGPIHVEPAEVIREALNLMFEIDEEEQTAGLAALESLQAQVASLRGFRDECERQLQAQFDKTGQAEAERDRLRAIIENHDGPGYVTELANVVAERDAALKEAAKWKRKAGRYEQSYGRAMRRIEQSGGMWMEPIQDDRP